MWSTFGLILAVSMWACAMGWLTQYDMPFNFTCPPDQFLAHLMSEYKHYYNDRVWDFKCRHPGNDVTLTNCEWSGYVNEFDRPLIYQCTTSGIITGISSYHENYYEDRRFRFQCCQASGYLVTNCDFTPYVNNFDEHMEYVVEAGKIMRGADGYHNNNKEDRRWKFEICELVPH
ncbi:dermatopontin-like [Gigantopelta aegis]|uniref:dermatopontin-like n=1 Tax=Gigantopelta aegis TaxID=1735272 RepID=UPI001B88E4E5|nr:dermatopontin-like [Gigantopelta aegis]